MEDNLPGSQPEINADYIDKLLSLPQDAQDAPVQKATDTPATRLCCCSVFWSGRWSAGRSSRKM